ncbi:hypothetical protein KQJ29_26070, partial [Enterococcus sp. S181_ASV_20]|nr:hypothetical protein [Enterococcus sp. S181_ASV_20]
STQPTSSAASDVYKRQVFVFFHVVMHTNHRFIHSFSDIDSLFVRNPLYKHTFSTELSTLSTFMWIKKLNQLTNFFLSFPLILWKTSFFIIYLYFPTKLFHKKVKSL